MSDQVHENEIPLLSRALAEVIRTESYRQRIKQRELAAALHLSAAQVSQRLNGRTPFRVDEVDTVAGLLKVEVWKLMQRAEGLQIDHYDWVTRGTAGPLADVDDESPQPVVGGGSLFVMDEGGTASGTRTPNPLVKSIDAADEEHIADVTPLFAGLRAPGQAVDCPRPIAPVFAIAGRSA